MKHEQDIADFIKYHNAVPIMLALILIGGSGAFAASNPESIYLEEQQLVSIDNSYIVSVDLERYQFFMRIVSIAEDDRFFYVTYEFSTIDIVEGVWQDVIRAHELKVSKELLRGGKLDVYVETELAQVKEQEVKRLLATQTIEKELGVSPRSVSKTYSGLIGKFIKPDEDTAPFYEPPPEKQAKNNPLALQNPVPLVTWDENAIMANATSSSVGTSPTEEDVDQPFPFQDVCPNVPGFQLDEEVCTGYTPPEETATSTPPINEPPPEPPPTGTTTPQEVLPEPEPEPEPEPTPEPTPPPESPSEPTPEPEPVP